MPIYSNRPRGPAGGDLSGSYPDPQVINLSGSGTGSFSGSFVGDGSGLINLPQQTIPVVSSSHILYVSADSTDTGADGSFNKPFKTISASLAYAKTTYTSAEHVEIFLNPGSYPAFTLDRHNTYIRSDLSHERQRGATISGPVVINCTGSNQKYNQIVGFDGLFIAGPSNSTSSTVYLTGSGAHLAYFKDCYLYSNTNTSHIFKCDTIFGNPQGTTGNKIVFKDSTFLAEKSGSSFLQLNGGDIEFNSCRLQANITGSGTFVSGSGDLYIAADRLFVETYTNGNIFEVSSSRSLALVVANSSLSTYGTGKPVSAPLNAVLVGNNFFGGAIANNFNISALAVSYSNLSSITASNPVTISASVLPLPMWETHGNIIASSLTASLKGNGSQVTNLTASNITNFTADVRNQFTAGTNIGISSGVISVTGSVPATVLTSGSVTGSGVTGDEVRLKDTINVTSITASNGLYDYIDFNTSASTSPTFQTGRLHYGSASLSSDLEYDTDIAGVTLRIGQQLVLRVRNNTASQINKGKIVEVSGSAGSSDVLYIHTASWENDLNSANTIGMVMENIAAGTTGYIILNGVLNGIDTSAFNAGDMLYLSSSGNYTNVRPSVPYHEVRLGHVARAQINNGSAFIRIQNGYELDELHDVDAPSASHGDLLMKSGSNNGSQWINSRQLSGSYGLTGSLYAVGNLSASAGVTGSFSGSGASVTNITASNISNFSADVRKQFTAGTNIGITGGVISVTGSITGAVDGTGTANKLAKWSDSNTLTNSSIYDDGTKVGIGNSLPVYTLDITGDINITTGSNNFTVNSANIYMQDPSSVAINTPYLKLNNHSNGLAGSTPSIGIKQATDTAGVLFQQRTSTNEWVIYHDNNGHFSIRYNLGANGGYVANSSDVGNIDFTGQHRTQTSEAIDANNYVGCIVCSSGEYSDRLSNIDESNISINESVPKIILSNKRNDKAVFGVISNTEDAELTHREYTIGSFVSVLPKNNGDNRIIVNSLGEGAIWVCNINGNFENGDYITSCEMQGLGMKQDDDLLHNYTVAKITCDCNFDLNSQIYKCEEFEFNGQIYKKAFVGCTYHCG
jgi:hypothetical protein